MTIGTLPFRTAIAVVALAVFAAFSISPTLAEDAQPESTTTTVAPTTTLAPTTTTTLPPTTTTTVAPTTTLAPTTTTTLPPTTTTTVAPTTTTTLPPTTTTTVAPTTTTTLPPTTTTLPPTTTTTMAPTTTTVAPTTTTTLPPTTTTTVPDESVDEADVENACIPEDGSTAVDTDGTSDDTTATTSSTTTTTIETRDAATGGETTGDMAAEGLEIDPCDPPDDDPGFTPIERIEVVRDIVFPIAGRAGYYDGFGACRDGCSREHFGIDIGTFGWKGVPVVASHDGTVIRTTYDQRLAGCAVILKGDDGWESRYVHLNTDFPGTDTSGYTCLAPGLEVGSEVVAGQVIGWVGDSGNAEHTTPHIHFEIRNPAGVPINSYKSLKAARTVDFQWLPQDPAAAYSSVIDANFTESAPMAIIVSSTEARKLSSSEYTAAVFDSPVLVIDEDSPEVAIEQIRRLELKRAIIMTDVEAGWLSAIVEPLVDLVEVEAFPVPYTPPVRILPDGAGVIEPEPNPADRFVAIIAGTFNATAQPETAPEPASEDPDAESTDAEKEAAEKAAAEKAAAKEAAAERAAADHAEAFERYTVDHRVVVLALDGEGVPDVSVVEGATPTRADESMANSSRARRASNDSEARPTPVPLWWNTGTGWIWTDSMDDVPERGIVYLTAEQATPWTLAFLDSIAELDAVPLWRG